MPTFTQKYNTAPLNSPPADIQALRMGLDNTEGTDASHGVRPFDVALWTNSLPTIAALRAFDATTIPDGSHLPIRGHTLAGLGGGPFILNTSGTIGANKDNNGTIIHANGGPAVSDPAAWYWQRVLPASLRIDPYMFGFTDDWDGVGNTTTDWTSTLQAMSDYLTDVVIADRAATSNGSRILPTLHIPRCRGVLCNGTVWIDRQISVDMESPIIYGGGEGGGPLIIGNPGNLARNSGGVKLNIRVARPSSPITNWSDPTGFGAKIYTLDTGQLSIEVGQNNGGFYTGYWGVGSGAGFVNSYVRFGRMVNCRQHLGQSETPNGTHNGSAGATTLTDTASRFYPDTIIGETLVNLTAGGASGTVTANDRHTITAALTGGTRQTWEPGDQWTFGGPGWYIQNRHVDGRFAVGSSINLGQIRYAFVLNTNGGTKNQNANTFYNTSVEIQSDGLPFLIKNGNRTRIYDARDEGNGPVFMRVEHDSTRSNFGNVAYLARGTGTCEQIGNASENFVYNANSTPKHMEKRLLFDSGDMAENAIAYSGSNTSIRNHQLGINSTTKPGFSQSAISWEIDETFTTDFATDDSKLLTNAQLAKVGQRVVLSNSGGALPTGLTAGIVWVVESDATGIRVASTEAGTPLTFTDNGTGTHAYNGRRQYVELPTARNLGVTVNTSEAKEFLVVRDTEPNYAGRACFVCFNAAGVQLRDNDDFTVDTGTNELIQVNSTVVTGDRLLLTSSGDLPSPLPSEVYALDDAQPTGRFRVSATEGGAEIGITDPGSGTHTYEHVYKYVSSQMVNLSWNNSFRGGGYIQGSDNPSEVYVRFRDEVKTAELCFRGGTNNLRLRRWQIYCHTLNTAPRVWLYHGGEFSEFYVTQAPAFGTYFGKITAKNVSPGSGNPMDWHLEAEGNPGTWVAGYTPP